ncbi:MAG: dTDP-glucose 4,6-dehydratase [Planctomycetota bacterium]
MCNYLVTGGAGFIGSCFVRHAIARSDAKIVNLDALTYAGNLRSIPKESDRHVFVRGDIADQELVSSLLRDHRIDAVIHFAAESHVDRSIDGPARFVETNVVGTYQLLESALDYFRQLDSSKRQTFRFLHVSSDEVYGEAEPQGSFNESRRYAPSSPYSASKAAADHFVRAWHRTYGLPTLITNCSNNYGPYQFPEKLIPLITLAAIEGKPLPVYGDGQHVRDWLHVEDHCEAIRVVLASGEIGETYNIGGDCERTNLDVVKAICGVVDELLPESAEPCQQRITFVNDRPGHDRRYAIDATRIRTQLGWQPRISFDEGIRETVKWYFENRGELGSECEGRDASSEGVGE